MIDYGEILGPEAQNLIPMVVLNVVFFAATIVSVWNYRKFL